MLCVNLYLTLRTWLSLFLLAKPYVLFYLNNSFKKTIVVNQEREKKWHLKLIVKPKKNFKFS